MEINHELMRALLLAMLIIPMATAVVVWLMGPRRGPAIRWLSLAATVVSLIFAAIIAANYGDLQASGEKLAPQVVPTFTPEFVPGARSADRHNTAWNFLDVGTGTFQLYLGIDGLNIWLIVLTALLMVPSVLISWRAITERLNEYYAWLLLLETGMLGVFLSFDILLFYVFFELTLVPLFFLIGMWGGPERRHAARKFFIYTLTGSLITLLGLLAVVLVCYNNPLDPKHPGPLTFSIPELVRQVNLHLDVNRPDYGFWVSFQYWVFLALFAGFAIKVPLVPLHTWLPLAHVEAPTAGSVLLAGVLLKIGTYGFLRLILPLAPDASLAMGVPLIGTLAVIGIIYGALCAFAQDDIKKLVAYSSVSHLGFCMLGLFALNPVGISGGLFQMINHGLSTGALFLLVGMLYERYHTRRIADYGGMGARLGILAAFWVFICLTSIGLPGLNGFVGEAMVFFGMFGFHSWNVNGVVLAVIGTAGIILGAWYLLTLTRRVFFGPVKEPEVEGHGHHPIRDLDGREWLALVPIAALCILIGVYPQPILDTSGKDINAVAEIAKRAMDRRNAPPEGVPAPPLAARPEQAGRPHHDKGPGPDNRENSR